MEKIVPSVKKTKDAVAEGLSTLGGVLAGNFLMTLFEKFAPAKVAPFSPVLGAAGFVPHFAGGSDNWKAFGNGLIAAGGTEALKKVTSGQTGIVGMINAALPGRGSFVGLNGGMFPLRGIAGQYSQDERLLAGPVNSGGVKMLPDELLAY